MSLFFTFISKYVYDVFNIKISKPMQETQTYTPNEVKTILYAAQATTRLETKYDPTLLAISALLEEGVRPDIIIDAFSMMGLSYGETFVLEGSKYKYKKIRNNNPRLQRIPARSPHGSRVTF
jgi:hypothetical protein